MHPVDAPSTAAVPGWTGSRTPAPVVLEGSRVRLEPLDADQHADELHAASHGEGTDPRLWDHLPYGPWADPAAMRAWLAGWKGSTDPLPLVVVDHRSGRACGQASYLGSVPEYGRTEIGHIWLGAGIQRTPSATEALALLVRHAVDDLGRRRLECKCNSANARSRRAAERLGFTYEGTFRQHMVVKGHNRDTAIIARSSGVGRCAKAARRCSSIKGRDALRWSATSWLAASVATSATPATLRP